MYRFYIVSIVVIRKCKETLSHVQFRDEGLNNLLYTYLFYLFIYTYLYFILIIKYKLNTGT